MPQPAIRPSASEASPPAYAVGVDLDDRVCHTCVLNARKEAVLRGVDIDNSAAGFVVLVSQLTRLEVPHDRISIGLAIEPRRADWGRLYHFLVQRQYRVRLFEQRLIQVQDPLSRRTITRRLDSQAIAYSLLGEESAPFPRPTQQTSASELVYLRNQLCADVARYEREIEQLVLVHFPEFTQVFTCPCRDTALALLKAYPGAQAIANAGAESVAATLQKLAPRRYVHPYELWTAQRLVELATQALAKRGAQPAQARSLAIWCDQLFHTQANLETVEQHIHQMNQQEVAEAPGPALSTLLANTAMQLRPPRHEEARQQRRKLF